MKNTTIRIFRFAVIGTMNAIIIAFVIWLMMKKLSCHYIITNIVAYLLAQTNNFLWCKYWVFKTEQGSKHGLWEQLVLFAIAFAIAYSAQFAFLILMVEVWHVDKFVAQFLGMFIYGAVNFIANKRFTFRVKTDRKSVV